MVITIPIQTRVVVILVTHKAAAEETEEAMEAVIVVNRDLLKRHVPPEVLHRPIRAGMTMEETEEEDTMVEEVEGASMIDVVVDIQVVAVEEVASAVEEEEVARMNAASKVT